MRSQQFRTKANTDVRQAAAPVDYFPDFESDTLAAALRDLVGRGPGWRRSFGEGLDAPAERFADQAEFVRALDLDDGADVTPRERG